MNADDIAALKRGAESPVQAGARDLEAVASDLSAAFADYPMFRWFMRDDHRREAARLNLFRLMVGAIAMTTGAVMRPPGGGAAAVWIPSDRLGPTSLWEELRSIPVLLGATGWSRFPRMAAMRGAMDRHHPMDRPHAYLWLLGVRPEAQGLGIGSRLLAAGLAEVDAQRLPAFLETSTEANVALYRRHGFEVTEEYFVTPDSPPTWTMWREPLLA